MIKKNKDLDNNYIQDVRPEGKDTFGYPFPTYKELENTIEFYKKESAKNFILLWNIKIKLEKFYEKTGKTLNKKYENDYQKIDDMLDNLLIDINKISL